MYALEEMLDGFLYERRGMRGVVITRHRAGHVRTFFTDIYPTMNLCIQRLFTSLPHYLLDLTRFAYHTGWCKSEILTLEWLTFRVM